MKLRASVKRLTNMVDAVSATRYSYDAVGQLLSEDGPWDSDTVSYTYANRLRTGLSLQAPNASPWTQSYGYDAAKRLTTITSPAGQFTCQYPAGIQNLVSSIQYPNGSFVTNTYDSVARLLSTTLKSSEAATINSHSYTYNQASQRTQQAFTPGNYVDYTYDNIGQLKTAKGKEPGGATRLHEQLGYAYDAADNLNWRTNNALLQQFTVNNLNELSNSTRSGTLTVAGAVSAPATSVTVNDLNATLYTDWTFAKDGFTLANGTNTFTAIATDTYGRWDTNTITAYLPATNVFTYDANGNLLSDGNRCFAYDDENQLTSVWVTNQWRSDFAYDGKMRRRIRKEYVWQSGIWNLKSEIHYVYDGNLVIQERDGNNLPQVSYARGRDLSGSLEGAGGIGGLLARFDHSTLNSQLSTAFYHCDGNGNITCLINTNQLIVAHYLYDPYGNILGQSGPLAHANRYRFSSKELHAESGLVYYLYRFYQPSFQRWPNRDPVGEFGFQGILGLTMPPERIINLVLLMADRNLYEFVGNGPVHQADYFGLTLVSLPPGSPPSSPPPAGNPSTPSPCNQDFTNKTCREACDSAFGDKNAAKQICYKICNTMAGKTCNELFRRCTHIAAHGDFGSQGGKICMMLYDTLCAGQ